SSPTSSSFAIASAAISAGETTSYVAGRTALGASILALSGTMSTKVQPFSTREHSWPSRIALMIESTEHPHNSAATDGTTQHDMICQLLERCSVGSRSKY